MKKIFTVLIAISLLFSVSNLSAQCIWTMYTTSNGLIDNTLGPINIGPNGKVAIATDYGATTAGFSIYDGIQWKSYEDDSLTGNSMLKAIAIDNNGMVWYGGSQTGLHAVKGNYRQIYHASDGLGGEDVESLFLDKDGYLWIGSWGGGVTKMIDSVSFTKYNTTNSSICDDYIVDMDKDIMERIYMAGYNGCVSVFDNGSFTSINTDLYELTNIAVDDYNNIWAAGFNTSFNPVIYKYDSVGNGLDSILDFTFLATSGVTIYDIATDYDNNLYVATNEGLAVLKLATREWKVYKSADGLPANTIKSAVINDRTGVVWISSDGGAAKLESKGVVEGKIFYNTNAATGGYVKVFKFMDAGVKKLEMYDSVGIDGTGKFMVDRMTIGKYTLLAVLDDATYPDAIPTYYGDLEVWTLAATFKVLSCDTIPLSDLNVIEKLSLPKGSGRISGYIKSLDGTRAVSNPIKDVDVTLKKVPGGVVQKVKSNSSGLYEFNDLPNGVYTTLVDLPGLKQDSSRTIEITPDDTTYEHQDYGIDSNGIHIGDYSSVLEVQNLDGVTIYPNPATKNLNIRIETNQTRRVKVELYDLVGRNYISEDYIINGAQIINLDVEEMPKGIYILNISEDAQMQNTKILIK
jgi:hypothetical protein